MFALVNDCKIDIILRLINLHDNFANSYQIINKLQCPEIYFHVSVLTTSGCLHDFVAM